MTDLKDRVGLVTAGNANLITGKGDMLAGDGEQTVYLRASQGADGQVLTLDSTANEGFAWKNTVSNALWPVANPRFYALDGGAGDDTNAGFSDTSAADAFTKAKKTWAALLAIIPAVGSNRTLWVGIKVGTYAEPFILTSLTGYQTIQVVGSTDGSDDATDQKKSGFVTSSAGPGGGGEWTSDGTGTVNTVTVSTGALPAEPAAQLKRIRFTGNVTAALANVCTGVYSNTGTTITMCEDLAVAPANGDTFFIEEPGVVFSSITIRGIECNTFAVRGIKTTGTLTSADVFAPTVVYTGIDTGAANWLNHFVFSQSATFTNLSGTTRRIGQGCRASAAVTIKNVTQITRGDSSGSTAGTFTFQSVQAMAWGDGCRITSLVFLQICGVGAMGPSATYGQSLAGFRLMRNDGNLVPFGMTGQIRNVNLNAASLCVRVFGFKNHVHFYGCTVRSQIEVSNSFNSYVAVQSTGMTFTLTTAQFVVKSASADYSDVLLCSVKDDANNEVLALNSDAPSSQPIGERPFLVLNSSGGTLTPGQIVKAGALSGALVTVTLAKADTAANASGGLLAMITTTVNNGGGYAVPLDRSPWVKTDAAVAGGAILYLSTANAGQAMDTIPALAGTNQKRRLGAVGNYDGTNTRAHLMGAVDNLPVLADGLA